MSFRNSGIEIETKRKRKIGKRKERIFMDMKSVSGKRIKWMEEEKKNSKWTT